MRSGDEVSNERSSANSQERKLGMVKIGKGYPK